MKVAVVTEAGHGRESMGTVMVTTMGMDTTEGMTENANAIAAGTGRETGSPDQIDIIKMMTGENLKYYAEGIVSGTMQAG